MPRRRSRSKREQLKVSSAASQIFSCIDSLDEITQFFGLLDMCLDKLESSGDLEESLHL